MNKKVFVSGCYDMLHSGHVAFFKEASRYGDLYVGIGSDRTIEELKNRKTVYSEKERLYMVKAIRYVTDAYINPGSGMLDFLDTLDLVKPDIFVVNSDGGSDVKHRLCADRGIEYIELQRVPDAGLEARSTTSLRSGVKSHLPYRIDLAGTSNRPALRLAARRRLGAHRLHRAYSGIYGAWRYVDLHAQRRPQDMALRAARLQ